MLGLSVSHTFTLQFSLGIWGGLLAIAWCAGRHTPARVGAWLDAGLGALLGGTLGARALHILLEWDYFHQFPADSWKVWYGGLNWHGAVVGGLVGAWLVCRWRGAPFSLFTDALALALPFGFMSGWWACRDAGCAYGQTASNDAPGWLTGYLPDGAGNVALRYELQIGAVMLGAVLLALATWLTLREWRPGKRLWLVLFLVGLCMFLLGFARDDPADTLPGLRLDQGFDLALMLASVALGMERMRGQAKWAKTPS